MGTLVENNLYNLNPYQRMIFENRRATLIPHNEDTKKL